MTIFPPEPPNFLAAFLSGVCLYLIAVLLTVYDGLESLICQPFCAAAVSSFTLLVVTLFSAPIFWWEGTRRWWYRRPLVAQSLIATSLLLLFVAALLAPNSEAAAQQMSQSMISALISSAMAGWHGLFLGVLYYPARIMKTASLESTCCARVS